MSIVLLSLMTFSSAWQNPCDWISWPEMLALVRTRFPQVSFISTAELAAWLSYSAEKPILLDVRELDEFNVSHLPDAILASEWQAGTADKQQPIVVYCSVGYRSAEFASELTKKGFLSVVNLEGSIFAWANENRHLLDQNGAVKKVHPYDQKWGCLLNEELRSPLQSSDVE